MNPYQAPRETPFGIRMLLLSPSQVDRIVRNRRAIISVGFAIMVLPFLLPQGWGFGFFSGFMIFSVGVYTLFFRNWRSEPGLWMLATLLTFILCPCWAYFEYLHWQAMVAPAANQARQVVGWNRIRLGVDASLALLIFARTLRLLITVAIENWTRTRIAMHPTNKPIECQPNQNRSIRISR